jgi:1-aminocyclopropane-1-carboxylate deaminase/D-cysteine desulfhydrase-like pyridoxal-dependent ACC family enzyme
MSVVPQPVHPLALRVPSPLERLADDRLDGTGVKLLLKRDDLIHADFPGNKWRKLKYNLLQPPMRSMSRSSWKLRWRSPT